MKWVQSFKRWFFFNQAYLHKPRWDTGITPPELIEYVEQHQPGKALDIGCGSGFNSLYLANQGWMVDGVDFSWLAILKARRKGRKAGQSVHWMVGDATRLGDLPLRQPFDLVLDIGCLHGLGDEQSARVYAGSIPTLLKPGGGFLLYVHEPSSPGGEFPSHGLNLEWIQRLFTPALDLLEHKSGEERVSPAARQAAWYYFQKPLS